LTVEIPADGESSELMMKIKRILGKIFKPNPKRRPSAPTLKMYFENLETG